MSDNLKKNMSDDFQAFPTKRYVIEISHGSTDDLDITSERKREIDGILRETYNKHLRGELKTYSLEEFLESRDERLKELLRKINKGDNV